MPACCQWLCLQQSPKAWFIDSDLCMELISETKKKNCQSYREARLVVESESAEHMGKAYAQAAKSLRQHPLRIHNKERLLGVRGFGNAICNVCPFSLNWGTNLCGINLQLYPSLILDILWSNLQRRAWRRNLKTKSNPCNSKKSHSCNFVHYSFARFQVYWTIFWSTNFSAAHKSDWASNSCMTAFREELNRNKMKALQWWHFECSLPTFIKSSSEGAIRISSILQSTTFLSRSGWLSAGCCKTFLERSWMPSSPGNSWRIRSREKTFCGSSESSS